MKKSRILLAIMMIAAMLVGCGSKEVVMKEFASNDGSCSIELNEKWIFEDSGMDNWIAAFSEDESEGAMVMQFTKGVMDANISDVDGLKEIVEGSYVISNAKEISVSSSVLSNVEAYTCNMDVDGMDSDGCVVYGETDNAYYVVMVLEKGGVNDAAVANFQKSVASFKENL